jgi:hypothetical protein
MDKGSVVCPHSGVLSTKKRNKLLTQTKIHMNLKNRMLHERKPDLKDHILFDFPLDEISRKGKEIQDQVPARLASPEASLLGQQITAISLCSHMAFPLWTPPSVSSSSY